MERPSIHCVMQSLSSDSTLLIAMLHSVAPEQQATFVDLFTSVLLRGEELSLDATAAVLSEMLVLELDRAAWRHRDFHVFMRGESLVTLLVETLASRTVTTREGVLTSQLARVFRQLCEDCPPGVDGGELPTPGTSTSVRNDSVRGIPTPGTWTDEGTITDVYHRFSTSELQGLAGAEQQFLLELESPSRGPGWVPVMGEATPSLTASMAAVYSQRAEGPGVELPLSSSADPTGALTHVGQASLTSGPVAAAQAGRRPPAVRVAAARDGPATSSLASVPATDRFTAALRVGLDYFADLALVFPAAPPLSEEGVDPSAVVAEAAVRQYVSDIAAFLADVLDLLEESVTAWPRALRRALWLLARAVTPPSCVQPLALTQRRAREADAGAEPPWTPARSASEAYETSHSVVATVAVLRVLSPVLLSMPSYIVPVDEDVSGPVYTAAERRVTLVAKLLLKSAYGQLFDEQRERAYVPLNAILPLLTGRWMRFFSMLTDTGLVTRDSLWARPTPAPVLSPAASMADEELVTRLFEQMDETFVQYQHVALLARPGTEGVHLSQWMRLTNYLYRSARGRVGRGPRALQHCDQPTSVDHADSASARAANEVRRWTNDRAGTGICSPSRQPSTMGAPQATGSAVRHVTGHARVQAGGADPPATAAATEAFEEVVRYVLNVLIAAEAENAGVAAPMFVLPGGPASGAAPLPRVRLPTPPLLRNYCTVLGAADDGSAAVMIYGDLLLCYLSGFYANERQNAELFTSQCPRFASHRARMLRGRGGEAYRDGDALAQLYFLVYLSVTQNFRSGRYYLVFLHDNSLASYGIGLSWLLEVVGLMPPAYQRACTQVVLVKPKVTAALPHIASLYRHARDSVSRGAAPPGGPLAPPVVRVSQIQELARVPPVMVTYLPLPIFAYQLLMRERKRDRTVVSPTPETAVGGVLTPAYAVEDTAPGERTDGPRAATAAAAVVSPLLLRPPPSAMMPVSHPPAPPVPRRKAGHVAIPYDVVDHEQRRYDFLPPTRRHLHERWARPLTCWTAVRQAGVWMLQVMETTLEVIVTASCRRSFTDGGLYPLLGVSHRSVAGLAVYVTEFFARFDAKALRHIGQEPKWLRESAMVTNGPVTASAAHLHVQVPSDVKLHTPDEERLHHTWLQLGSGREQPERDGHVFEATLQRLIFISTEVDGVEEGRGWDQIVSTRWGIDLYRRRDGSAGVSGGARPAGSSRFVPSLRQAPLRVLWRLLLYNAQQLCAIVRASTPAACPLTRMAAAVETIRTRQEGAGPPASEGGAVAGSLCDGVVVAIAGQALAACYDAEINIVRLVVAMCGYLRSMHALHGAHKGGLEGDRRHTAKGQPPFSDGLMRGVAELIYSRQPNSLGERRVVELLACHGDQLMREANLPFHESCSWHPYSRLWYSA